MTNPDQDSQMPNPVVEGSVDSPSSGDSETGERKDRGERGPKRFHKSNNKARGKFGNKNKRRDGPNPHAEADGEPTRPSPKSAQLQAESLSQLAKAVQAMLMAGELDMGHARALLALPGSSQVALAQKIVAQGLSVREAERMAATAALVSGDLSKKKPIKGAVKADQLDQDLRRLAQNMADIVGLEVEFKNKGKGGELRFYFSQFDELDSLMKKLGLESN